MQFSKYTWSIFSFAYEKLVNFGTNAVAAFSSRSILGHAVVRLSLLMLQGPPCKPALRVLSERYLRRAIQQGEHDSVVDACAALDLVKLKVARGPAYGTYLQGEQGDKLMDVLHRHNKRCTLVDRTDMLNRHVTGTHL